MTIEINQLKIISKVNNESSVEQTNNGSNPVMSDEEKNELIEECCRRMLNYLERLQEV